MLPLAIASAVAVTLLAVWLGIRLRLYRTVPNFRGRPVPIAGLGLVAGTLAGLAVARADGDPAAGAALVAVAGFGLFGAIDDFWGDRSASGFRGHLKAAMRGRLTTGFWKIIGGGLTALIASWLLGESGGLLEILPRAAVIALGANSLNLLDTRPVRATAAFLALSSVSLASGGSAGAALPGIGSALAWLPWDRSRRAMLGDAGSNALGALCSVAAVATAPVGAALALLAALIAFHVYTEARSLNADLAACPPLDRLDRWLRGGG